MINLVNLQSASLVAPGAQDSGRTAAIVPVPGSQSSSRLKSESSTIPAILVGVTPVVLEQSPASRVEPGQESDASPDLQAASQSAANPQSVSTTDQANEQLLRELSARDREVRQHELAHKAAAGGLAGAVSYSYQRGPDGRLYAVGGEVSIKTTPPSDDPEQVLRHAEMLLRAATAPAEPSAQDLQVAAAARMMAEQARAELAAQRIAEQQMKADQAEQQAGDQQESEDQQSDAAQSASGDDRQQPSYFEQMQARKEEVAAQLQEYQDRLNEIQQNLYEVNQRLTELGVLENLYSPGALIEDQA